MIEIKSNSSLLDLLMTCSIPLLFIAWIVTIVLLARKRIIEGQQMSKQLNKGAYSQYFNYKWMLMIGFASALLFFIFSTLVGFVLIAYKNSVSDQVPSWIYLSLIAIPAFCGGVVGILLLFLIYKRNNPSG